MQATVEHQLKAMAVDMCKESYRYQIFINVQFEGIVEPDSQEMQ